MLCYAMLGGALCQIFSPLCFNLHVGTKSKKGVVMAIEAVKNYSVGLHQAPKANLKSQQSFTSKAEVDEEKSNATKYMVGATALAAVIGLGIAGYKGKLGSKIQKLLGGAQKTSVNEPISNKITGEKVVPERFNSPLDADITVIPRNKDAMGRINYVEELKWNEISGVGHRKYNELEEFYNKLNWDQKPFPAQIVKKLERDRSLTNNKVEFLRNNIMEEFDALRAKGFKIDVKDLENDYKEILYTYPEASPIKSKTIKARFKPEEHSLLDKDKKNIFIEMKDGKSYSVSVDADTIHQGLMQMQGDAFATKYSLSGPYSANQYIDYVDDLVDILYAPLNREKGQLLGKERLAYKETCNEILKELNI